MDCQEFAELSGAYALGALTPEEQQRADEHLAHCPDCQRTLQELQSVVQYLPLAAPAAQPSPQVKKRLLQTIESSEASRQATLKRNQRILRQRHRASWSIRLAAIAAVLLIGLLGAMTAWNISLQQQLSHLSAQYQQASPVAYTIRGTSASSEVTGELLYFPQQHITALVIHGLPQLEGAHVYQGWLIQNKHPESIGLLNVHDGTATVSFQGNITGYDTAAVSIEPGPLPSSTTPRGQIVAVSPLSHAQARHQDYAYDSSG